MPDDSYDESTSAPLTREGEGVMKPRELSALVGPLLTDAVSFADTVLAPERELATDYYHGKPFGNEEDGRSQAILTVLRDTVSGIVPDLMRLFFGPERVVEFLPKSAASVADAKQRTDYVHYCFTERNNGFLETLAVLKDGLIRKVGVFKSWWDDSSDVRAYTLRNVTDEQLDALAAQDDIKILGVKETGVQDADDLPPTVEGQPAPQPQKLHTVHITRTMPGRIRVKALPPEEFLYNRSARDAEHSFVLLAHRTRKTRGELIALGIDGKVIDAHGGSPTELTSNREEIARQPDGAGVQEQTQAGKANELHEYTEAYVHVDVDGDGIAELRQVCTLGPAHYVVNGDGLGEPVDEHPFALFVPDPEPHTLHGSSIADRTMDLQLTMSSVLRAQLDSLAAAIFPRMSYIEGQANVNDLLNTEIGAPIRTRSQNAVQAFQMPFSGEAATPVLQFFDEVTERRTGRSKGADGLDLDALQSTTGQGVDAAVAGSRAQTEMLARVFAEMTLKPLFRRMYRLIAQNQPEETVKLRDAVVTVDPSAWEDELDVTVNVAIGSTFTQKKLAVLADALAKQEQVLQLLGPQNPIVSVSMYAATLQRGVELGGFKDVESFFKSVDPNWQPPQQPPEPSPEMAMVQIEQQKAQAQQQNKQIEMQQKASSQQQDMQLAIAKMQQDFELKTAEMKQNLELAVAEMQAKYGVQTDAARISAEVEAAKEQARIEAENERAAARIASEERRHKYETDLAHQREVRAMELEHERGMREVAAKAAKPAAK